MNQKALHGHSEALIATARKAALLLFRILNPKAIYIIYSPTVRVVSILTFGMVWYFNK